MVQHDDDDAYFTGEFFPKFSSSKLKVHVIQESIRTYIHINSQSVKLSWNCSDKQYIVVTWLAAWVLWCLQSVHQLLEIALIIIIIIIMSCRRHGYPWPPLATSPYRSSPLAGLQGYIPCPHIAAGCMFEVVVLLLLGHMWGSIGVHHLWARRCFSSSDLHVWLV